MKISPKIVSDIKKDDGLKKEDEPKIADDNHKIK